MILTLDVTIFTSPKSNNFYILQKFELMVKRHSQKPQTLLTLLVA